MLFLVELESVEPVEFVELSLLLVLLVEKLPDLNPSLLLALEFLVVELLLSEEFLVELSEVLTFEELLLLDDLLDEELLIDPDLKPLLDFFEVLDFELLDLELLDFELDDLLPELDFVFAYTWVLSVGFMPDKLAISIGRLLIENTKVRNNTKISFLFNLRMTDTSLIYKLIILYKLNRKQYTIIIQTKTRILIKKSKLVYEIIIC